MSGYILNREGIREKEKKTLYRPCELELMTTHQLREICRRERIIQGILNPMDKEELVHTIMRYRGARDQLLIRTASETGIRMLEMMFDNRRILPLREKTLRLPSRLIVYEGLSMDTADQVRMPYHSALENTNALLVSREREVCGIFHLRAKGEDRKDLYVVREPDMPCRESDMKEYDLYCFPQRESDMLFSIYYGLGGEMPEHLSAYKIPLMEVEVRKPIELRMPLVIGFGADSTTAGVWLDTMYFEETKGAAFAQKFQENTVQYTVFPDGSRLVPTVAGVAAVKDGTPQFVFGQAAVELSNAGYVDEGFSIFYDMKQWICDPDREEEIADREGRRTFLARRDIIREFLMYVVSAAENCFKCRVRQIHVPCPVRQTALFQKLFHELLPEYILPDKELPDEGVAILYNTISGMLESRKLEEDTDYQALVLDCGSTAANLCACQFRFHDDRVAYHISIRTAYENGDADFGGNLLTYRIMQYIKLRLVERFGFILPVSVDALLQDLDTDAGATAELYNAFEEAYDTAEQYLPTRFREYGTRSREEYFKVRNNFYHLFYLAEQVKKQFYGQAGILRVGISSDKNKDNSITWVQADKWKLSVQKNRNFCIVKEFPEIIVNLYEIGLVVRGEIYGAIQKLMEPLYQDDRLRDFSFLRLTGQSCKIDIFKEALKEFIPGRMIQFRRSRKGTGDTDLKMGCVDGALKFIRDKRLGYVQAELYTDTPLVPYTVTALTHNGKEVELINGFQRREVTRYVSRNLEDLTLYLYLRDTEGRERYRFCLDCGLEQFREVTYEDIQNTYNTRIPQKDTDSIVDNELRFFAWKCSHEWGYVLVPVYRRLECLYMGDGQFFPFEHEGWMMNYYDGMK